MPAGDTIVLRRQRPAQGGGDTQFGKIIPRNQVTCGDWLRLSPGLSIDTYIQAQRDECDQTGQGLIVVAQKTVGGVGDP